VTRRALALVLALFPALALAATPVDVAVTRTPLATRPPGIVQTGGRTWTDGSSPTAAAATELNVPLLAPDGRFAVTLDHPRRFRCYLSTAATTRTLITGCSAPGAGLAYYVTGAVIMGGVVTGATAAALLESGTGGTCGAATVQLIACQHPATSGCVVASAQPIGRAVTNGELCITSGETGTKWVTVWGYVAP
jgi:hypothetical protein